MQAILAALAKRTSYSFAVTVFSVAGGQTAALVGFLFIVVTVDLSETGTLGFLLAILLMFTGIATAIHYLFYGLATVMGKSWGLAWLRPLNDHTDGLEFKKDVPSQAWPAINRALERMPLSSTKLAGALALSVVGVCIVAEYGLAGSTANSLGILRGGLIATVLYAVFSFTIIEMLTFPARREARRKLIDLQQGPIPKGYSRLPIKLGMFLVFILVSIIISHGLFTVPRAAFSPWVMASFGAAMLLLGLCGAVLVFLSIIKPLNEIKDSAALLSTANQAEFSTGSLDREFISTAAGFYEYARRIVDFRRELQDLNQALEGRVAERTKELSQTNNALEQKIEDLHRAEQALKESEEKHRMLVEKMQEAVILLHEGVVVFANQAFVQMLGHPAEKLAELTFEDVIAPEDLEMVTDYYRRRLSGESAPDYYEFNLIHRDGQRRIPVLMSVGLIKSADGAVYTLATLKDITELKAADLEREERARLEGVMAMAGATCHELNQPLQAAFLQCELVMDQIGQDHDLYQRLSTIQRDLDKLGDLTNKIQRITRYETTDYLGESTIIDIDKASE